MYTNFLFKQMVDQQIEHEIVIFLLQKMQIWET